MGKNNEPMTPGRKISLPVIYGDTPSFLGCPVIKSRDEVKGYDVAVMGVPWEGTITWGTYSGCELAPKTIRHAAARYGGFLPEYEIDIFDHLKVGDYGDVLVYPSDPARTMKSVEEKAAEIYAASALPVSIGGDHSYTPEIVKALTHHTAGKVGVIHFDAHLDNLESFGSDEFPRCGPLYRILQLPGVKKTSTVHVGIRGPRNAPSQLAFAKQVGARVLSIKQIRERGIAQVIAEASEIARDGTTAVYVTICSDVIEASSNPGGPPDFDGLSPHELFYCLRTLGMQGFDGLDFVEVYPLQDRNGFSSHLAAWAIVHGLAGIAMGRAGSKVTSLTKEDGVGIAQAAHK